MTRYRTHPFMMVRFLLGMFASCLVATSSSAQSSIELKELDAYIAKARSDWEVPGLAVAIVKDGEVVIVDDCSTDATVDQKVASGFNRNHVTTDEGGAINEEYLVEYAVDRTATTGSVFLGLTVGCCQCHTHKYDPLTQREYYQLYAFFDTADDVEMEMGEADEIDMADVEADLEADAAAEDDAVEEVEAEAAEEIEAAAELLPDRVAQRADAVGRHAALGRLRQRQEPNVDRQVGQVVQAGGKVLQQSQGQGQLVGPAIDDPVDGRIESGPQFGTILEAIKIQPVDRLGKVTDVGAD